MATKKTGSASTEASVVATNTQTNPVATVPSVTPNATPPETEGVVQPTAPVVKPSPVISPALQARIDARKANIAERKAQQANGDSGILGTTSNEQIAQNIAERKAQKPELGNATVIGPNGSTTASAPAVEKPAVTTKAETTVGADGSKVTTSETTKTGDSPEMSDAEKIAQQSGVAYKMDDNGQPIYSPGTKEEALKILQTGGKLNGEDKLTKVAQDTLNRVRNYAQMTDKQLSQAFLNGSVSPKDAEMLNQINPDLVRRAKDFQTKSQITDTTNYIQADVASMLEGGKETPIQNKALTTLFEKLSQMGDDNESFGDVKARVYAQYPGMDQARQDIVDGQTKLRELQRSKRQLFNDYKAKNAGLPISMIVAGYSTLSRSLDDQIYEVNDTLSQNVAIYNSYLDDAKSEIDWELNKQKSDEERLWKMYGVQNEADIREEDIQREDARISQDIQLEEYRYQRALADGNTLRAEERKQKLQDLYDERDYNMGIVLRGLGVDPTGMTSEEMSRSYAEVSNYYNQAELALKNQPKASDFLKSTITNADGSTAEVFINPATGESINPTQIFGNQGKQVDLNTILEAYSGEGQALLTAEEGSVIPTRLSKVSPQNAEIRGKECAEYVNDIAGTKMGNSYESKKAVCNEKTGNIGSVVAWHPNGSGDYGHAGIIVGEDGDNWLVRSSNLSAGKVTTDPVPKSSIAGYYTPPEVKDAYMMLNVTPVQKEILAGIDDLLTSSGFNSAVGFGFQKPSPFFGEDGFIPGTDAEDFRKKFNTFRDNMVLPNLGKLKGPMSDKDIEFLRNSATSLSLSMSEEEFTAELNRIREKIMGIGADEY